MYDTSVETLSVCVHFVSPVEGVDPEDGQLFLASRHRVEAAWMRQDSQDTLFLDCAGEVVAGWDTELVDRVVWRDGTSMSVTLQAWQAQMDRETERRQALREAFPRAYHRWLPEEDDQLTTEFHAGFTVIEMMREHGRARGAIMARLVHLELVAQGIPSGLIGRQAPAAGSDADDDVADGNEVDIDNGGDDSDSEDAAGQPRVLATD